MQPNRATTGYSWAAVAVQKVSGLLRRSEDRMLFRVPAMALGG